MSISSRSERLKKTRRAARPVRLNLEAMEDRTVPAQAVPVGPDLFFQGPGPNATAKVGESLYFIEQDTAGPPAANIWHVDGTATAQPLEVKALDGQSVLEMASIKGTLYVTAYSPPTAPTPFPWLTPSNINLWKIDPAARRGGPTDRF